VGLQLAILFIGQIGIQKRAINKLEEVIRSYSQDNVTRGCGYRAEDLFCKALALRGFMPVGTKVKEYKGKRWTKTDHNLEFRFHI
jgi:hypothetical protein